MLFYRTVIKKRRFIFTDIHFIKNIQFGSHYKTLNFTKLQRCDNYSCLFPKKNVYLHFVFVKKKLWTGQR